MEDFFDNYTKKEILYLLIAVGTLLAYRACETSGFLASTQMALDPDRLNWSIKQLDVYSMVILVSQGKLTLIPTVVYKRLNYIFIELSAQLRSFQQKIIDDAQCLRLLTIPVGL